jgi:hypothetical protein
LQKNGYNNINDSKDERRPSQIKSQKTMPREILDDIKDYQEEESESLKAVQKQLKLFCALVAFCCFLISSVLTIYVYILSENSVNNGPKIFGIDLFFILLGFPYALMFTISATISNLELYPNPWNKRQRGWEKEVSKMGLAKEAVFRFFAWSIISPIAGGFGFFLGSLPIAFILMWISQFFFDNSNPPNSEIELILGFSICYIITHLIWAILGYFELNIMLKLSYDQAQKDSK